MVDELSKLAEIQLDQIVDSSNVYFSFSESAEYLRTLLDTSRTSLQSQGYFSELPVQIRNNIQTRLRDLINLLVEIINHKGDREWMSSTYANNNSRIQSLYNELYEDFVRGVREYVNAQALSETQKAAKAELERSRQSIEEQITELKRATKEALKTSGATKDTLKLAEEATSKLSAVELSKFYEDEVFSYHDGLKDIKLIAWWERWCRMLWRRYVSARGYELSSGRWLILSIVAIVVTTVLAYIEFKGINYSTVTLNTVFAKAILLLAPAYAIRFCVRNFNINKHLVTVNRQRAVVMKTVIALFTHPSINAKVKEQALVAAINHVFSLSETGYVTQRDGTGTSDAVLDLSNLTNLIKH